jgi:hypothetical protein
MDTALQEAVERASRAPSILNTQPWRWRVAGVDEVRLYADRGRQLHSIDADGRMLTISCGAALHHLRVALCAAGHEVAVDRFPGSGDGDHLATVRVTGPRPTDIEALRAMAARHSDRRPFAGIGPVPPASLARLRRAAEGESTRLDHIGEAQLPFLATAVAEAAAAELAMPDYRDELDRWTHRPRSAGDGVPAENVVAQLPRTVPVRDFAPGRETLLDPGTGDDRFAEYLVVVTEADTAADWLRAGEATSAVWLAATPARLALSVLSDVVEIASSRAQLAALLTPAGQPQLLLRVGSDMQPGRPAASPRRPIQSTIDSGDDDGPTVH